MNNISLVIPTYNRCNVLKLTMPYYLKQKNVHQIIVVDDASTDETESYLTGLSAKNSCVTYIRQKRRMGPHHARNTALCYVSGDYVLVGEDDVIFPENYSHTLQKLMADLNVDIAGGQLLYLNNDQTIAEDVSNPKATQTDFDGDIITAPLFLGKFSSKKTQNALFLHACALFRKEIFDTIRWDETYQYNYFREETDVYLNARAKGFKILYTNDVAVFHLPAIRRVSGGCRHFQSRSIVLKLLASPRKISSYNLSSPLLRTLFYRLDFDDCVMKIINNNYFIDKYFPLLKNEMNLNHSKNYYKIAFAKNLIKERLS